MYDHIGEGAYEETEEKIKELLKERAAVLGVATELGEDLTASGISEQKTAARSPETYFGSFRNEYLGNGTRGVSGEQTFALPKTPKSNTQYLGGVWNITGEYAEAKTEASVVYR